MVIFREDKRREIIFFIENSHERVVHLLLEIITSKFNAFFVYFCKHKSENQVFIIHNL